MRSGFGNTVLICSIPAEDGHVVGQAVEFADGGEELFHSLLQRLKRDTGTFTWIPRSGFRPLPNPPQGLPRSGFRPLPNPPQGFAISPHPARVLFRFTGHLSGSDKCPNAAHREPSPSASPPAFPSPRATNLADGPNLNAGPDPDHARDQNWMTRMMMTHRTTAVDSRSMSHSAAWAW